MTGNFDIFDAYSGRPRNSGLIPGYILALTKADLLGSMGHILLGVLALDGQVRVFSPSHRAKTAKVACFNRPNRGASIREARISVGIHPRWHPM